MSPLDRVTNRFERNHEQAQRSAKEQLSFILSHAPHLLRLRGGATKLKVAKDFQAILDSKQKLTPNQLSFCDAIYEATWKGMGVGSVKGHSDRW